MSEEAREHEAEPGEQAPELAAPDPAEVHAQLVRLGAGQHLVYGERLLERLLVDPAFLVDALALDHRDLSRRPAPRQGAELEEAGEDRRGRVWGHRRGILAERVGDAPEPLG